MQDLGRYLAQYFHLNVAIEIVWNKLYNIVVYFKFLMPNDF